MHDQPKRPYLWLFASLAVVGFGVDQASKYVVFAKLYPAEAEYQTRVVVIPGLFDLRTVYQSKRDVGDALSGLRTLSGERLPYVNRGALFGIGNDEDNPDSGGMNWFFALVSVLAAVFIIVWAQRSAVAHDRWLCLALGLILGGTLGNLYDRLVFDGVRDFLHFYYTTEVKTHVWPDFNIADCCLVCGAFTLLAHSFLVTETPPKAEAVLAGQAAPLQASTPTPSA